ncbi:eukaryotic translation initiation factor 3 subunit H [Nannizzia gypsea CBS 118893]|uniref:Eukaryotic translation initiation factor 3 subunit H n=1 Tax=Arthroderma gypseum (strain ATCC MYA-4604 / CBS 118893) TaxID=535722 RepID=E4V0U7_ARTGP|nr:eukaryotic translation initiation factor 3 subunit H [Nannizzia gypsea CBS 118893]EFR03662.1 eukaryotic translation initiation factor 3 subunit H [Nannizzia gypsea CBS 118893]
MAERDGPLKTVQVDALVVMKIIKHCTQTFPTTATGSLVGMDVKGNLEVTNSFPFPIVDLPPDSHLDISPSNTAAAAPRAKSNVTYQAEMIRMLREVNIDANNVGYYTSANMGNFLNLNVIENQYFYQKEMNETAITLVHDVSRSSQGPLSLRAFRLSPQFMTAFKENKFTAENLQKSNLRHSDIFVELPVTIHNSHLLTSYLHQIPTTAPKEELDLPPSLAALLASPQSNPANAHAQLRQPLPQHRPVPGEELRPAAGEHRDPPHREQQLPTKIAAWQAKRKAENVSRAQLKQPLLAEDEWQRLFKLPQEPSRLESMLNTCQAEQYSRQIDGFVAATTGKMFGVKGNLLPDSQS